METSIVLINVIAFFLVNIFFGVFKRQDALKSNHFGLIHLTNILWGIGTVVSVLLI